MLLGVWVLRVQCARLLVVVADNWLVRMESVTLVLTLNITNRAIVEYVLVVKVFSDRVNQLDVKCALRIVVFVQKMLYSVIHVLQVSLLKGVYVKRCLTHGELLEFPWLYLLQLA